MSVIETEKRVTVYPEKIEVEVDVDDVFRELTDEDIEAALQRRLKHQGIKPFSTLHLIYEEFVRRGDAPQVLKDYLYKMIGRIL